MKYLFATILLTLSMSAFAASNQEKAMRSKVICKEGYKFLIVWVDNGSWRPPTVVQIYKEGSAVSRPPQPIACK